MPLYEYRCEACGERFEVLQKFSDPTVEVCTKCGKGPVQRLMSSPAIQFKGTGWYITDYAKKSGTDSAATTKPGSGTTESKSESSAGESSKPADSSSSTPAKPAKDS